MAEKKGPLTDPKYTAALATNRQQARALGIDAVMANPSWMRCSRRQAVSMARRSGQRRQLRGELRSAVDHHLGRGYPHITGTCRLLPRAAGGRIVLRPRLERADFESSSRTRTKQATKHRNRRRSRRARSFPNVKRKLAEIAGQGFSASFCGFCVDRRKAPLLLCALPDRPATKNGPSRSRYIDVCCVLLIAWTIAESGYRSFRSGRR